MVRQAKYVIFTLMLVAGCLFLATSAYADEPTLPESVIAQADAPFTKVGHGVFRKFGFRIYEASLWAPQGKWEPTKPYALQLHYARSLSKDTLIDTVMDDITDQGACDKPTCDRWRDVLDVSLSDVEEGDTLIGLTSPNKKTLLFYNGKTIANVDDHAFSDAFFGIWLGKNADEDMRNGLLGGT
jgi:hypothetical protein